MNSPLLSRIAPLALALLLIARTAPADDGVWSEVAPPDYRLWHSCVHDPVHHRVVVFGGLDGQYVLNDVWILDLANPARWRRIVPEGEPPIERYMHGAVFDAGRNRMVVFGGAHVSGGAWYPLADTWALELSPPVRWTKLAPPGAPPPRMGAAAVYDRARDRMVVFGGLNNSGIYSDVWALSFAGSPAWTQLAGNVAPLGGRVWTAAALDSVGDKMLIQGGGVLGSGGVQSTNDTWSLALADGMTWNPILTGNSPGFRYGHAAAFDPVQRRLVISGGFDTFSSQYLRDTRILPLGGPLNWGAAPTTGEVPPPGLGGSAVWDGISGAVRLLGGWGGEPATANTAVWSLRLTASPYWMTPIAVTTPPVTGRYGHAVAWDATHRRLIVFGGRTAWYPVGLTYLDDVWIADLAAGGTWSAVTPLGVPPAARSGASLVYDPDGDRVVLFGGEDANTRYDDTWSLSLSGAPTWTPLAPSGGPPPARVHHGAILDPARDRMLVFGGLSGEPPYQYRDVWALSLAGAPAWSLLAPGGTKPAARYGARVALDAARDRMLVFGGRTDVGADSSDVWALSLAGNGAWTRIPADPGPVGRMLGGAVVDPVRDRLLVLGGATLSGDRGDLWALPLSGAPIWSELHPAGAPDSSSEFGAAYDAAGDAMVVYGGTGSLDGLWRYRAADVVAVPAPVVPEPGIARPAFTGVTPHPARAFVDVAFTLPQRGHVALRVFDARGRRVATLFDGPLAAGRHALRWNDAARQPPGVYLLDLRCGEQRATQRLVLMR